MMDKLFLGILFAMLDVHISLGSLRIGLLPDFVGYILMMKGLKALETESQWFSKGKLCALVMAVFTGVLYVMDLLEMSAQMGFLLWFLGLAALVVSLLLQYWIICGVRQMEARQFWDLQGDRLKSLWLVLTVMKGICYVCSWVPVVGTIAAMADVIIGICYLTAFYQSKKHYQEYVS